MSNTEKPIRTNRVNRLMISIGIFLVVQLIFMLIDGTPLEPNINDSGNLLPRIARGILDSKLFTEWITPYSFSFFNLCMTIHLAVILIQIVWEIKLSATSKK
ncbi:YfzA family protein [Paenibacillus senegalensis]|uniref:YfzA family protein n=1 Tax=Paenibacillus senegalensis TaxID=1465766 RepID=UPI000289452A|nr:YfzA family protein [Paenibacillus senegalensis]